MKITIRDDNDVTWDTIVAGDKLVQDRPETTGLLASFLSESIRKWREQRRFMAAKVLMAQERETALDEVIAEAQHDEEGGNDGSF